MVIPAVKDRGAQRAVCAARRDWRHQSLSCSVARWGSCQVTKGHVPTAVSSFELGVRKVKRNRGFTRITRIGIRSETSVRRAGLEWRGLGVDGCPRCAWFESFQVSAEERGANIRRGGLRTGSGDPGSRDRLIFTTESTEDTEVGVNPELPTAGNVGPQPS